MLKKKAARSKWNVVSLYLGEGCICCSGAFCGCSGGGCL